MYGSASATLIVSARKVLTFGLSVVVYPKPFNKLHMMALVLVTVSAGFLQLQLMADEVFRRAANSRDVTKPGQSPFVYV